MAFDDGIVELNSRRLMALEMGGAEAVRRHHEQGKLTARERIAHLVDFGSFREFGMLAGDARYDDGELVSFIPKPHVDGYCHIDGRPAVVRAGDFTVRGGSGGGDAEGLGAEAAANTRALELRIPFIRLLDAAGGSVRSFEELGRTYLPDGNRLVAAEVELLDTSPVVAIVLGSVAGLPAIQTCLSHWSVMVASQAQVFAGGPPVVKAALGASITKEDLGGVVVHGRTSGVVDNVASTELEAFELTRRFLSYLPSSVEELPPVTAGQSPACSSDGLRDVIGDDPRQPFDIYKVLASTVDKDSFFEIAPDFGKSRVTGLARIDGMVVGLIANNPARLGGSTDIAAAEKVMRMIRLCDVFHIPIVDLADEPGFMVGVESERRGIERGGARLVMTVMQSRIPWLTIVLRRLYGVAGQCNHRPSGTFRRYAWPSARWGSMHIIGGVSAAYRREIEASPDPVAKRLEIEDRLQRIASPFRTAEATGQDIIDPAETRDRVVEFVHDVQRVLRLQAGSRGMRYFP